MVDEADIPGRWADIDKALLRNGPLATDGFEGCEELKGFLRDHVTVLCVGAGGLGCELLKDLALSGFRSIHVIDMDTIDVSNLNRQFLFRHADVGKPKALVAAEFVNKRVAGANITPHYCKIQDKDADFYRGFTIVVCGLDSVAARRWMNGMLCGLVEHDEQGNVRQETIVPMVDGGTEGFKGQVRVIYPHMNACFECTISTFPPQVNFPMCTIASTPRLPEHCIEYAKVLLWPEQRPDDSLDLDNPAHIQWLFDKASARAAEFNITGVTYRLTQGVAKHIIPAIASTNAAISAQCSMEAFKVVSGAWGCLKNNMLLNQTSGVYSYTFEYERDPDCIVCGAKAARLDCSLGWTLARLVEALTEDKRFDLGNPSVRTAEKTLRMVKPPSLEESTRKNLQLTLAALGVQHGEHLTVTDEAVPRAITLLVVAR